MAIWSRQERPRHERREIVLRRYRVRLTTGVVCIILVIPLSLWSFPLAALAAILGFCSQGLALRGLLWDDVSLGGLPFALRSGERRIRELVTVLVLLLSAVFVYSGIKLLLRNSDWAMERFMSQFEQYAPG